MKFSYFYNSIKNSSVNKIIVAFGFSNLFILLANLVSGIFIMKFINPYEFGVYNKFLIVVNYIILLNFGIPAVLQTKLPGLLKIKSFNEVTEMVNSAYTYFLIILLPTTIIFLSLALDSLFNKDYLYLICYLIVIVNVWQNLFQDKFLKILYRTSDEFKSLIKIQNNSSVISFVSSFSIIFLNVGGILVKNFFYSVYNIVYLIVKTPLKFKFNTDGLKKIINEGFKYYRVNLFFAYYPVLISNLAALIFDSYSFGILSLYFLIRTTLTKLLTSIDKVIYIKVSERFYLNEKPHLIYKDIFIKNILPFMILYFIITFSLSFFIDDIIILFFPLYTEGVGIIKLTLVIGFLLMFNFQNIFFDVFKKLKFKFFSIIIKYFVFSFLFLIMYLKSMLNIENILHIIIICELTAIMFNFFTIKKYIK